MILIDSIKIKADIKSDDDAILITTKKYNIKNARDIKIVKKSIDARKKDNIQYIFSIALNCDNEDILIKKNKNISKYEPLKYNIPSKVSKDHKVCIIGMGPAGLFCAYILAKSGVKVELIERGEDVDKRYEKMNNLFKKNILDPSSNVQFGEGGAGTFSDGKLNTAVKDKEGRKDYVLDTFVRFGAYENILYDSKPHIGSDVLRTVIKNMRNELINLGVTIHFSTKFDSFTVIDNKVTSIECVDSYDATKRITIECDSLVLATGHSSRDTFEYLKDILPMEQKAFAIGYRVIHHQEFIDKAQYGNDYKENYPSLPVSPYKLTYQSKEEGRGVYSFCMCPGGYVVNASSEEGRICVNGMSNQKRDSGYANSAIIVQFKESDYKTDDILEGMYLQRDIEEKTYKAGNGVIPVCNLSEYINSYNSNRTSDNNSIDFSNTNEVNPNDAILGNWKYADLIGIYPKNIENAFVEGMNHFDRVIDGFASSNPLIVGSELRSSSPVRILRDDTLEASIKGIYPCGEGAGYAGGIVSAAMDGMKVAEAIINKIS
ncbi:MAG: FAD-dependent oxidoreductase [Lachnospiraceae bacterium]|nr:FAD-dependent oxidoreductase [Lachnospiraceae bacterium]